MIFWVFMLTMFLAIVAYCQWAWWQESSQELAEQRSNLWHAEQRLEQISDRIDVILAGITRADYDDPTPDEVAIHEQQLQDMAYGRSHGDGESPHRADPPIPS